MSKLTIKQLARQDFVDNACHDLIAKLNPVGDTQDWDITEISKVREAVQSVLEKHGIKPSAFYPSVKDKCEACNGLGILPNIERCDACERFESNKEASDYLINNFTREDWKYQVQNGDTVLGYADWCYHRLEMEGA